MRKAAVKRKTKETDVEVEIDLDGTGASSISTGIGFFDHMLDLLARHSRIDITVKAKGDLHIDHHHTTEDVGIALGQAVKQALGDMKGITRYAERARADGRGADPRRDRHFGAAVSGVQGGVRRDKIGDVRHRAGAGVVPGVRHECRRSRCTSRRLYGTNDHHISESCFKGLARALRDGGRDRSARRGRGSVDQGNARRLASFRNSPRSPGMHE